MWRSEFEKIFPLLGHRNWIAVVDKAFPLQSSAGVTTVYSGESIPEVLSYVLGAVRGADYAKPVIYTDAELHYLDDTLAKGVEDLRHTYAWSFVNLDVQSIMHEEIFRTFEAAAKLFSVFVIKTDCLIPYSSVFIELDCGYWSACAENELRSRMKQ